MYKVCMLEHADIESDDSYNNSECASQNLNEIEDSSFNEGNKVQDELETSKIK